MKRSKWKGPFIDNNFIDKIFSTQMTNFNKSDMKTFSRNSTITPVLIGLTVFIHNGKSFSKLRVTEEMVGHKLGEFTNTRGSFSFKKKKR